MHNLAKRIMVMSCALTLTGCAPELVASNERGGIIGRVSGLTMDAAFKTADAQCHKYNRVARINETDWINNQMTYDCVSP